MAGDAGMADGDPSGSRTASSRAEFWEKAAVGASFWFGAVGLTVLKSIAYFVSGSTLIRAAMFESLGDVVSNAIMAITQWQVNTAGNIQQYPLGKTRFAPLGVLFFSAFMCSAMSSLCIESLSALASPAPQPDATGVDDTLRRIFQEKARLRWAMWPADVEALVQKYGEGAGAASVADAGQSVDFLASVMLAICVAVKLVLYVFCGRVFALRKSEIVRALMADHRNDCLTNTSVIGVMALVSWASQGEEPGPLLSKMDPAASLLLAGWIVYGWGCTAIEQLGLLSDARTDRDTARPLGEAAQRALQGTRLQLRGADVYHAGEGLRVRLELQPQVGDARSEEIAASLDAVEKAVREADDQVLEVDTQLRSAAFSHRSADSFSWVAEYASK